MQTVPGRINPRRNTPRHTVIKLTKIKHKEKLLKATRGKWQITYKGTTIRLTADFSAETLQARREWHDIFQVMKGKNPRVPYPERISFRFAGEIKSFTGLSWWHSGWESACQCRGHGFEPWSGKIPHAAEWLGPWATIAEPTRLEPVLRNKRGRDSERPAHRDEEWPPPAATRESPHTETKTQHSQN